MADQKDLALVTGISGFVAKHVALEASKQGFRIRGTVRTPAKGDQARQTLIANGVAEYEIEIVQADLLSDSGWDAAMEGCSYVFHVASPFPLAVPKDPQELIKPAKEGTERVMGAALRAGVKRFVVTSSAVAVFEGREPDINRPYTEEDWSPSSGTAPYNLSKTLAERAAWDFAKANPAMEVVSVNPSFVLGPPLDDDMETSAEIISMLLNGKYPMTPKFEMAIVDVRDLARVQVAAMKTPDAAGERILATNGESTMLQISKALAEGLPEKKKKLPTRNMPNFMVRIIALFDQGAKAILPFLGKQMRISNDKAKTLLGIEFNHDPDEATVAMGKRCIEAGLVK